MNNKQHFNHGDTAEGRRFNGTMSYLPQGNFGWLYRNLPAWKPELDAEAELENLAQEMKGTNRCDGSLAAGYTYFAQLVDHDLTFDPSSLSQQIDDPEILHHYRTPAFDLDCIYGRGPRVDPHLYSEREPERLRLTKTPSGEWDLPRFDNDRAIVADARNDDLILLSQLHVGISRFHNQLVEILLERREFKNSPASRERSTAVFLEARRLVRWHYQWVVLHDFLPKLLHPKVKDRLFDKVLSRLKRPDQAPLLHYRPETSAYLPIEFTAAAFRFAHCLPRASYQLNPSLTREMPESATLFRNDLDPMDQAGLSTGSTNGMKRLKRILGEVEAGNIPIFTNTEPIQLPSGRRARMLGNLHPDLRGRRKLPPNWGVDWSLFLAPLGAQSSSQVQRAMSIEPKFSLPLFEIPVGPSTESLASLDLKKGYRYALPSGQTLARRMGLDSEDLLTLKDFDHSIDGYVKQETPLLYYILAEAKQKALGQTLGVLGSEIIGETFIGLMLLDSTSYLNENPRWTPNARSEYCLLDLLRLEIDEAAIDQLNLVPMARYHR